jgi:hypothetical protein
MSTFDIVFLIALAILLVLIVYGTIVKNRWGIPFVIPNCPRCGKKVSFIRVPKSVGQFVWGGYTCSACGCEIDKYGREIPK